MTPADAVALALKRADSGLSWEYPCLVWVGDFLRDATGVDPMANWRGIDWTEETSRRELARLAAKGDGNTAVERALDAIAKRDGWTDADCRMQGAVMVGVYEADGIDGDGTVGVPAIFDFTSRWVVSNDGRGWTSVKAEPKRMWEVPCAA